jgi:predicted MPP superfamily phosphohydrolase
MSLEWIWLGALSAALLPAIGHLYHFVLAVNVSSSFGLRETTLHRIRACLFVVLLVSAALLFWSHLADPWWTWSWPARAYALLCVLSGGALLPINSLLLAVRKRPAGIVGHSKRVDLRESCSASGLIGTGRRAWELRLPGNEAFALRMREWELFYPDLPESLDELSIVQLSDLHFATCYDRRYFERIVEACRGWTADLVVVTGDLIEHDETIAWIEPVLGRLDARLGKFAILGNHDVEHQPERVLEALAEAGFESLEGRWVNVAVNEAVLALGGTSAPWGPLPDPGTIPPAEFRLLLSHCPDQYYRAAGWGMDLVLSGHNHGGQIRLPVVGPVFMPSRYSRRFDRGFFRRGRTLMYVTEGIAGTHPARYGCPPEICRFVLRSSA